MRSEKSDSEHQLPNSSDNLSLGVLQEHGRVQPSTLTGTGTTVLCGIEYNEYPPPGQLLKAMKRYRAEALLERGLVRIHGLEYYRRWENNVLGDPNDGKGLLNLHGNPLETDSGNDVYAWCLSLPNIKPERQLLLAAQGGYDCILVLESPEEFFQRARSGFSKHPHGHWLHCGLVAYNRGESVVRRTANAQKFHFNVFQKAPQFREDLEYRMSVTNCAFSRSTGDYLDLEVGSCRDVLSIRALPTRREGLRP